MNEILSKKKFKIVDFDLLAEVWKKRPDLAAEKIFILEDKYTGKSYKEKVKEIRASLKRKKMQTIILSQV